MAKEELKSKKILKDIHKIEEDVHSYKKEHPAQWSQEGVHNVHKVLTRAKEEESRLTFKLHKAEHKEDDMEKRRKRNQDSATHSD
jgi:hypothetical protein